MARSYGRRKAARKGGLLVRENPIQRIESVNSLYCIPAKESVAASAGFTAILKTSSSGAPKIVFGSGATGDPTLDNVVRISSVNLSSKSPFTVTVTNSAGGDTVYQCPGQTIAKITLSRETSVAGNAALLKSIGSNKTLMAIKDAEDAVDVTFYCVVDSNLDS